MANGNGNKGGKMVFVVGGLLFLVSFFTPIAAEYNKAAEYHYFPDVVRILASVLQGVVSGLATVIAFLNSSYTRYKDAKAGENGEVTTTHTEVTESIVVPAKVKPQTEEGEK